jgi:hypothetical protein
MTKKERRIAVAKDVIKHLNLGHIDSGSYLESVEVSEKADIDKVNNIVDSKTLQANIDSLARTCKVCALGACFISYIRLYDSVDPSSCVKNFYNGERKYAYADYEDIIDDLKTIFNDKDLIYIESAFERSDMGDCLSCEYSLVAVQDAIDFGRKYSDPKKRLRAIMKNIIDNDGTFTPKAKNDKKAKVVSKGAK